MENNELPTIRFSDVNKNLMHGAQLKALLDEKGAHALTLDSEPVFVIMTVEHYIAMQAINPNPKRLPEMVRIKGKMFREVV